MRQRTYYEVDPTRAIHACGFPSRFGRQRTERDVFRMRLAGVNTASKAVGAEPQIAKSNYLIGNDHSKWRTDVPNYRRVRFAEVYPGIDLVYNEKDRQLE